MRLSFASSRDPGSSQGRISGISWRQSIKSILKPNQHSIIRHNKRLSCVVRGAYLLGSFESWPVFSAQWSFFFAGVDWLGWCSFIEGRSKILVKVHRWKCLCSDRFSAELPVCARLDLQGTEQFAFVGKFLHRLSFKFACVVCAVVDVSRYVVLGRSSKIASQIRFIVLRKNLISPSSSHAFFFVDASVCYYRLGYPSHCTNCHHA